MRFMVEHDLDREQVLEALRGDAVVDNVDAFEQRIEQYMDSVRQRILEGLHAGETDAEIWLGRFKNTQGVFEQDVKSLIHRIRTERR